jgi:hypothetical protein
MVILQHVIKTMVHGNAKQNKAVINIVLKAAGYMVDALQKQNI